MIRACAAMALILAAPAPAAAATPPPAAACTLAVAFDPTMARKADAVFVAALDGYEVVPADPPAIPATFGLLTVRVVDPIRGTAPYRLQLVWPAGSLPSAPDEGLRRMIVATLPPGATATPGRERSAFAAQELPERTIVQPPCGAPFLLPYSSDTQAAVERILAGEVPPADFDWFQTDWRQTRAARLRERDRIDAIGRRLPAEVHKPKSTEPRSRLWLIPLAVFVALLFVAIRRRIRRG